MEFKECWPVAIPPCFTLKVTPVQTHSKTSTFYTPVSHILWFWCSTLHFHADPFTVYPVRIAFTIFNCFLISVLVHLNDLPFFYIFVFLIVIFPFPLDSSSLSFQPLPMESSFSLECQVPDSSIHQQNTGLLHWTKITPSHFPFWPQLPKNPLTNSAAFVLTQSYGHWEMGHKGFLYPTECLFGSWKIFAKFPPPTSDSQTWKFREPHIDSSQHFILRLLELSAPPQGNPSLGWRREFSVRRGRWSVGLELPSHPPNLFSPVGQTLWQSYNVEI